MRLAVIYGHLWINQYQDEEYISLSKCEWQGGLKVFDSEILAKVLERCRDKLIYPPSLPMFINFCKAEQKAKTCFVERDDLQIIANKEVGKAHIAKIRSMLRGEKQ